VKGLQELGEKHHATAGQVILAWLLSQGEDIIPIPGTKKIKVSSLFFFGHGKVNRFFSLQYLKENLGALKIKLTPDEIAEVREIARKADAVHGDRYPAYAMENLFADTPPL